MHFNSNYLKKKECIVSKQRRGKNVLKKLPEKLSQFKKDLEEMGVG